ncbi:hypothetical protein L1987_17908 [Smallanthus sonchifolius]|uniref:Uncharacterized protein n=1 Tax=Smallanthus sonchifolius TaxID=185202 RepID=A0ACB9J092_9ASTR|nr:hypothetical protein L1987_17908 [Smallanthus sonchifolius]
MTKKAIHPSLRSITSKNNLESKPSYPSNSTPFSLLLVQRSHVFKFQIQSSTCSLRSSYYIYYLCIFLLATAGNPSSTRKEDNQI